MRVLADGSPAPAPAIAIRVEVSPNGDDFLRCAELVQSYVLKASSLSPSFAPVQGGTVMALRGRCLPNMASTALRIDVTVPGKPKPACLSFAAHCDYVNSETLTFLLPRLEVPEPAPAITPMSVAAGRSVDSLPALTAHSAPPILQELPEPDEPLRPLLPPGKYAARVFVALDGVTFEDTGLGFTAYSAQMGSISPLCGVLSGGTTVTFQPDVPTGAVKDWFIAGPDNAVRVYNDDFDVVCCS